MTLVVFLFYIFLHHVLQDLMQARLLFAVQNIQKHLLILRGRCRRAVALAKEVESIRLHGSRAQGKDALEKLLIQGIGQVHKVWGLQIVATLHLSLLLKEDDALSPVELGNISAESYHR